MKNEIKTHLSGFRLILLGIMTFLSVPVFPQTGNPCITNYKLDEGIDNQNWAIVQDRTDVMFFANRKGFLMYDGLEWNYVDKQNFPFSLVYEPTTNTTFAGCYGSFGYLEKNEFGGFAYHIISTEYSEIGAITQILFNESHLFFYSKQTITRVNIRDFEDKKIWRSSDDYPFSGIAILKDTLYINIEENGLHLITERSIEPVPGGDLIDRDEIIFSIPFDDDHILLATDNSFLYLFDGNELIDYIIKDEDYILESVLSGGIELNDQEIALTTLTGGCLIIEKESRETKFTLNYQTGLPDDEIYAIGKDQSNGLWLSHEFGTTRIDFSMPVWNFNAYPGLEGNLLAVIDFNNSLYVSTSEGVYYLNEVKDFKEIEILVKKRQPDKPVNIRKEKQAQTTKKPGRFSKKTESEETTGEQEPKKGLFSKLFKRKTEQETEVQEIVPEQETVLVTEVGKQKEAATADTQITQQETAKPVYTKQKTYALQSISHKFTKIPGLNDKCRQMIRFRNQLLVATNTGLYRILDNEVKFVAAYTYINHICPSAIREGLFYVGTPEGAFTINFNQGEWDVNRDFFRNDDPVYSFYEDSDTLWIGSETKVYRLRLDQDMLPVETTEYPLTGEFSERVIIRNINDKYICLLSTGCYAFDTGLDEFVKIDSLVPRDLQNYHYIFSQDGSTWVLDRQNWISLYPQTEENLLLTNYLKLFDEILNIYRDTENNTWIISGNNQLSKIAPPEDDRMVDMFHVFFKSISSQNGMNFTISTLDLAGSDFPLEFKIMAPYYIKSNLTQYQYLLEGLSENWSKWRESPVIYFDYLPPEDYVLHIRAKNILGTLSDEKIVEFVIEPPFTKSVWFFILLGIGLIASVYALIIIRERKLKYDKKVLEQKVKERTAEIEKQKREIESQRDEIENQKQEITDSIHYAQRIQDAILPPEEFLNATLPEHFILLKPRDIVSGDFYWIAHKDSKVLMAAADCTGHGVPGAFMSMLGYSFLNEISNNYKISKANLILNRLRNNIMDALRQTGKEDEAKDGMDIALCIYDHKSKMLQFSGAYNSLYIIRKKQLSEVKADRMPIGIYFGEKKSFTNHEIQLRSGDSIYLFSDGYIDQFGGKKGTKFMVKPFKKLLLEIQDKPMDEQKILLDRTMEEWRGSRDQVDDILVMGFRI